MDRNNRIFYSRSVKFNENEFPFKSNSWRSSNQYSLFETLDDEPATDSSEPTIIEANLERIPDIRGRNDEEEEELEFFTASSNANSEASSLSMTLIPRNNISYAESSDENEETACLSVIEPTSYNNAQQSNEKDEWKKAMDEEMEALKSNEVWKLVELPKGRTAISCKWIYRIKKDANGKITRYKARLVANGFSQIYGIDFTETYAPVVSMKTLRSMISYSATENLLMHQMDVKTAFLNGELNEEVYMKQPKGYSDGTTKVCKLQKTLYGLKQSPREWNKVLDQSLLERRFIQSKADPCLYLLKNNNKLELALVVYVDDLIFIGSSANETLLNDEKDYLKSRFQMTDLGQLKWILGIEVSIQKDFITLDQRRYLETMWNKFNLGEDSTIRTPLFKDALAILTTEDKDEKTVDKPYQSLLGSLMYLMVGTRPDIHYSIGLLARFSTAPKEKHWTALKNLLRYVWNTRDAKLKYERNVSFDSIAYSDSDFAGDRISRKSTSGYVTTIGNTAVTWKSKKQTITAQSTTEAEYIALNECVREAMWIKLLTEELQSKESTSILVKTDSMGAEAIANGSGSHDRSKHIEVKYHYVKEKVQDKSILLEGIRSENNPADLFTKPLSYPQIMKLGSKIGLTLPRGSVNINGSGNDLDLLDIG